MNTPLEQFDTVLIGERLRIFREAAGITQADAAATIGAARTTIVAIEQGQRRARIDELHKLSKLYGTSVNALLRQESVHVDLAPRFRKLIGESESGALAATKLLGDLAKAEVELENLLGIQRIRNYPPERPLLPGDVRAQADHDALEVRQWLGLGFTAVPDMVTLLELEMGVRVYVRRLDTSISGLFAYDSAIGACILLNANHPRERRAHTAAHEFGHLISTRNRPEVLSDNTPENSREERYANAFARSLLTPARAVMQKFSEVTAGASRLTRRHVIILAHAFNVSREAIVRRLEELRLTKGGSWDWFQSNGGITDAQAREVLGDLLSVDNYKAEANRPTTLRINLLAAEVWRRSLLSEGQLARLLHLDRIELREILDAAEVGGATADDAPVLLS